MSKRCGCLSQDLIQNSYFWWAFWQAKILSLCAYLLPLSLNFHKCLIEAHWHEAHFLCVPASFPSTLTPPGVQGSVLLGLWHILHRLFLNASESLGLPCRRDFHETDVSYASNWTKDFFSIATSLDLTLHSKISSAQSLCVIILCTFMLT